jgi:hypothetical protein
MGKYTQLKNQLQRFVPEGDWQAKVDVVKQRLRAASSNPAFWGEDFKASRAHKDKLEAEVKELNTELEACSQLLLEWMESHELTRMDLASGGSLWIKDDPYVKVNDPPALLKWIRAKKMGGLLTIHWQTLNSIVKEDLVAGKKLPPGVDAWMKTTVRLRGGKEENGQDTPEEKF